MMNFAAYELLETQEASRVKITEIEQHGAFANQCHDQTLAGILKNHQQRMIQAYQQGLNLLQGRGNNMAYHNPDFQGHYSTTGMQNQFPLGVPMPNTKTLSDQTIATLVLKAHKTGSVMSMVWANECVDPAIRHYHIQGALLCQEMAYDIWSWMNQNGFYQPPRFPQSQMTQMASMFQPMTNIDMQNRMNNTGNFSY